MSPTGEQFTGDSSGTNDLALVIPAFNEEKRISVVLRRWQEVLDRVCPSHLVFVLDDGSTDGTAECLAEFSCDPRFIIIDKPNEGHGPTILRGYAMAVKAAEWVFQADGDNEVPAAAFEALWNGRLDKDFLFGVRQQRNQSFSRRMVSKAAYLVTRMLCGDAVKDVNVPFRLMRSGPLAALLPIIPPDTFAPNVAISGLSIRRRYRIANLPLPEAPGVPRRGSLVRIRLLTACVRSFAQILRIMWRARR